MSKKASGSDVKYRVGISSKSAVLEQVIVTGYEESGKEMERLARTWAREEWEEALTKGETLSAIARGYVRLGEMHLWSHASAPMVGNTSLMVDTEWVLRVQVKGKVIRRETYLLRDNAEKAMRGEIYSRSSREEWASLKSADLDEALYVGLYKKGNLEIDLIEREVKGHSPSGERGRTSFTPNSYLPAKPAPVPNEALREMHSLMYNSFGLYAGEEKESGYPYKLLFTLCALPEKSLNKFLVDAYAFKEVGKLCDSLLSPEDILFKVGRDSKRKDKKRILFVAHRDTVIGPEKGLTKGNQKVQRYFKDAAETEIEPLYDTLTSPCFDDRLGIFTGVYMFPHIGIDADILLTTDEEIGQSTAGNASLSVIKELIGWTGEDTPYSHIVEFDRRGEDVVAYHYEDDTKEWEEMEEDLKRAGFVIGVGTFSDICSLNFLAKGINVAVGYHNEHSVDSTCEVEEYLRNLYRYKKFVEIAGEKCYPHRDTPHAGKRYSYYDDCLDHGKGGAGSASATFFEKAKEKNAALKEAANKVIEAYYGEGAGVLTGKGAVAVLLDGITGYSADLGLKNEGYANIYVDDNGNKYLSLAGKELFLIVEGDELFKKEVL
jgi:hypothetical protein